MMMKEVFEKLIRNALANDPPGEKDYVGENGMLTCGVCGEAKRSTVMCCGTSFVVPAPCRCKRERLEAEEAAERTAVNERHRAAAFNDARLRNVRFGLDDSPESTPSQTARRYAEEFDPAQNKWLLLYGQCGTGKSFLAACIANAVIDNGYSVRFTSISEIESRLWTAYDKSEVYAQLRRYDLLIIDDLCAERQTEYMNEIAYNVIDTRYRCGKPVIVTANLTGQQLMHPDTLDRQRIYSRIYESSQPVAMTGNDRRQQALLTRR